MAHELGSIVDSYSSVRGAADSMPNEVETDDVFGPIPMH